MEKYINDWHICVLFGCDLTKETLCFFCTSDRRC